MRYIIILFVISSHALLAQNSSDPQAIFSGNSDLKGFGSYDMKLTPIADNTSLFIGAKGGVTVNKFFSLGAAGYGLVSSSDIISENGVPLKLNGGYGGLLIGFQAFPRKVVHLSFPIILGGGTMYLTDEYFFQNPSDSDFTVEKSGFVVVEPGAHLEFNVTRFFHLEMGASYRYVQGLNMRNLTDEQLLGWAIDLSLKFGSF
jgi:hypothetical protein